MSTATHRLSLPVFLISAAVLAQELLLVRLLAIGLWHHVTYMVVTVALLAFGTAGSVLATAPRLAGSSESSGRKAFAWCAILFAATTFISGWRITGEGIDTINLVQDKTLYFGLFLRYMVCGLPLFFGGLCVVLSLRGQGRGISRVYFANLLGSALGCALFVALLQPLSGPGLLGGTALLAALAGLLAGRGRLTRGAALLALLASGALCVWPSLLPPIQPVPSKMMAHKLAEGGRLERTLWNLLCRVDVVTEPGVDSPKNIYQDGDATTWIFKGGDPKVKRQEIMIPYLIRPAARSLLIIGTGGGREIAVALNQGLQRIVGVDINSATVSLLKETYLDYSGRIAANPRVTLLNKEGRAFLSRSKERFDFIQMTGVDTYAALNSGAYVLSESYLYTAEAMKAYMDHLTDEGFLSILRFYFEPPRETLRLFVMALEELKTRGIKDPGRNAMVVVAGSWAALIVGRSPIPEQRVQIVRAMVATLAARHAQGDGVAAKIAYDPLEARDTPFGRFAEALQSGHEQDFLARYLYNVAPSRDDSPFFYNYHRFGNLFRNLLGTDEGKDGEHPKAGTPDAWRANTGAIPFGITMLLMLLVLSCAAGSLLVLGPLWAMKRRALSMAGAGRAVLYFSCLGLGFMFLEIGLAQRFALFLGHPAFSLAVVLGGMLTFSGLGSLASGRLAPARAMALALPAIVLLVLGLMALLPQVTEAWLWAETPVRVLIALAVLAPLAFFMGMPMPSGLRILDGQSTDLLPWAWATNGMASVLGSVLAIVLAMLLGFTGVLGLAAGLYLCALLVRPRPA